MTRPKSVLPPCCGRAAPCCSGFYPPCDSLIHSRGMYTPRATFVRRLGRPLGSSLSHRFLVPAQRNKNEMSDGGNAGIIASPLQRRQAAQQVYRTLKYGFRRACARGAQTAR
eukprot:scaffold100753_cov65-Phaeocystis_antarctica.AAC.2